MKRKDIQKKNNCSTCERRGNLPKGCQVFKEEPVSCWAHTTDNDWLRKVEKACKEYKESNAR